MMTNLRLHHALGIALAGVLCAVTSASAADLSELTDGEVKPVTDFKFLEGPAWHPDGYLLFTDPPNNRIVRVTLEGKFNDWLTDTNGINGLMCDQQGNIYACQGDAKRVLRLRSAEDGMTGTVAGVAVAEFDGQPFNKPNDLALDRQGGLYFTDPNYTQLAPTQPVEGVYYLNHAGEVSRVVDDLLRPNGILVSADGRTLYVANIGERQVVRYQIDTPGKLSAGEVIFTGEREHGSGPDGMSLDERGNIYATYQAITVLTPDGELIGRIEIPQKPANCTFGGPDNKTLYITARTGLYAIPMQVSGIPLREAGPVATSQVSTALDANDDAEETREVKAGPLTLNVPESWKSEDPSNSMRLAQFSIPAAKDDPEGAEYVLFSEMIRGSLKDNIKRWIGQFDAEGREVQMFRGKGDDEAEAGIDEYVLVDLTGTYQKSVGPPVLGKTQAMPNYRVINVMVVASNGAIYFLKLTGPKATVGAYASAFRATFGGDASKETKYTPE